MTLPLKVQLLGDVALSIGGQPLTGVKSRKGLALMVYLLYTRRPHNREALAAMFWEAPSTAQSLSNLRTLLTRLRPHFEDYLAIEAEMIAINPHAAIQLDVDQLIDATDEHDTPLTADTAATLAAALDGYQGDFLADFYIDGAPEFDEWVARERTYLRYLACRGYQRLSDYFWHAGEYRVGIRYTQQWIQLEPLDDEAHLALMQLLCGNRQPALALAHYEACVTLYAKELGAVPSAELTHLYQQLQSTDAPHAARTVKEVPLQEDTFLTNQPESIPFAPPDGEFIGRVTELHELNALLVTQRLRLITLLGPGGIGKSRLAAEFIQRYGNHFADGCIYVSLMGVDTLDRLVATLAQHTGLVFREGSTPQSQLLRHLASLHLLLVLDNAEDLLTNESVMFFEALYSQTTYLQLLVTSRVRLQLSREHVYPLMGLGNRDEDSDALALFLHHLPPARQRAAQADTVHTRMPAHSLAWLSAVERGLVRTICAQVEWLPLAIKLAAALTATLTLQDIVDELSQGRPILESDFYDVPQRHRSMRTVFASSWAMLTVEQQRLLAGLSVFQNRFTLEDVRGVLQADSTDLSALVSKSLLQPNLADGYRLHALVRQFAGQQLVEAGESERVHTCHATYFLTYLTTQMAPLLTRANPCDFDAPLLVDDPTPLQCIARAYDDISAAWQWSVRHPADGGLMARLPVVVHALWQFYKVHYRMSEASALLEEVLATFPTAPDLLRATWTQMLAVSYWHSGRAEASWAQTRAILQMTGHVDLEHCRYPLLILLRQLWRTFLLSLWPRRQATEEAIIATYLLTATACATLAFNHTIRSNMTVTLYALLLGAETGNASGNSLARAYLHAATHGLFRLFHLPALALQQQSNALRLVHAFHNPAATAQIIYILSGMSMGHQPWRYLLAQFEHALTLLRDAGLETRLTGDLLTQIAYVHRYCGAMESWLAAAQQIAVVGKRLDNHELAAYGLHSQGTWYCHSGDLPTALRYLHETVALMDETHMLPVMRISTFANLAWTYLRQGDYQAARRYADQTYTLVAATTIPMLPHYLSAYSLPAEVYLVLWEQERNDGETRRRARRMIWLLLRFMLIHTIGRPVGFHMVGLYCWLCGYRRLASLLWRKALHWARKLELPFEEAMICLEIGRRLPADHAERREWLQRAQQRFLHLGAKHDVEQVAPLLHTMAERPT